MPPAIALSSAAAFQKKLDRCGELLLQEAASKGEPWREELKTLKLEIQAHYADSPADIPIRAVGRTYYIDLSKRENQRAVSDKQKAYDALKKAMGLGPLVKALAFPFKLLDQFIPAEKQSLFVSQERSGARDLTAIAILPKAA